jgi:hypothetical protein
MEDWDAFDPNDEDDDEEAELASFRKVSTNFNEAIGAALAEARLSNIKAELSAREFSRHRCTGRGELVSGPP